MFVIDRGRIRDKLWESWENREWCRRRKKEEEDKDREEEEVHEENADYCPNGTRDHCADQNCNDDSNDQNCNNNNSQQIDTQPNVDGQENAGFSGNNTTASQQTTSQREKKTFFFVIF